jgi:transcriptional regulator with XRE-family HTH domain
VRIGARLRHARLTKGLSLRLLADAVGCSESFVSKIENNKVRPSIAVLHRLCAELDVNIGSLLTGPEEVGGDVRILANGKRPMIRVDPEWEGEGIALERAIPQLANSLLQANILHVAPGGHSDGMIQHTGEEFGYVICGKLQLVVGDAVYQLEAGDCFLFPSPLPHGYRNWGTETARVLWVNTPPSF